MSTNHHTLVREFRLPWISRLMICFGIVALAVSLGIAIYWWRYLGPERMFVVAFAFQVVAFVMMLVHLWMNCRTVVRLAPDRMEICTGYALKTIMKDDVRSVGWFTPRGPALKLNDDVPTLVPIPTLDGLDVAVLRRWIGSGDTDDLEARAG